MDEIVPAVMWYHAHPLMRSKLHLVVPKRPRCRHTYLPDIHHMRRTRSPFLSSHDRPAAILPKLLAKSAPSAIAS